MATPPYTIDATKPENTMKIASFPSNERTFRDIVKSWLEQIADPTTGAIRTASFGDTFTITSTDAGATVAPTFNAYRNSASPAVSDVLGQYVFTGRNDASEDVVYAREYATIADAGDGSEDGTLVLQVMVAGSLADRITLSASGTAITGNASVSGNATITGTLTILG